MNVTVDRKELGAALALVRKAISKGNDSLPILQNVMVQANGSNTLVLTGTNLGRTIRLEIPAEVTMQGSTTLPAGRWADALKVWSGDKVKLELEEKTQKTLARCARNRATFHGLDSQDFPIVQPPPGPAAQVEPGPLALALRRVLFAAAQTPRQPALEGVLFESDGAGKLTLATADGFRLSVASLTGVTMVAGEWLSPAVSLKPLADLIGADPVRVTVDERRVAFDTGRGVLICQLLEGQFPDYEQIIPKSYSTRVVADAGEFRRALAQGMVFGRTGDFLTTLMISIGLSDQQPRLSLYTRSDQAGNVSGDMDVVDSEGDALEIGASIFYLKEVFDAIGSKAGNVALEFGTDFSPIVIWLVGDDSFLHVIMPMHVGKK